MLNLRICLKYCNFKIRLFRNSSQSFTSSKVIKYIFFFVFSVTSKVVSIGGDFLEGRAIPLWILLLAVLAGLVFLALVSLILWHCGFFRRYEYHFKVSWILSYHLQWKFKLLAGKFDSGVMAKHCLGIVNKLLKTKRLLTLPSNVFQYYLK